MGIDRLKRVNELLRREISEALYHVMSDSEVDMSLITITRVVASRNLRQARVMVSIRDHENERDRIMSRLRRHRPEIQSLVNRDLVLKYTPKLIFQLDTSLEEGDHVLEILSELDHEQADAATVEPDDTVDGRPAGGEDMES